MCLLDYLQLYTRHSQYLSSLVGSEFELPPPGVLRLVVYGEILSAKNFEYDNLFIRYIVNVPPKGEYHPAVVISLYNHPISTSGDRVHRTHCECYSA